MPVYAIIATGIASAKFDQVGASPKWMFVVMTCGEKIRTNPSPTSSSCVAKSSTASRTFRLAASLMPTMFSPTSSQVTPMPTITSHGVVRSGSQKIER